MWLRKAPRLSVGKIVCIDIGEQNGGIISNISEGGLCFRAIAPVERGETIDFCLSEPGQRIGGKSRVVWTDESQKRGGLSFANLSVHARKQIYSLITEPAVTGAAASVGGKPRYGSAVTNSVRLPSVSPQVVQTKFSRGFSTGRVTGVLVSLLVASAFLYHRQIGTVFILMGQHLASTFRWLGQQIHQGLESLNTVDFR